MLMAAPAVSAFTLDDIFQGKREITLLEIRQYSHVFEAPAVYRQPNVKAKYIGSFGTVMERVPGSDNQVIIRDIAMNEYNPNQAYSFIFTLSDDGSQLVLGKNDVSIDDNKTKLQCMKVQSSSNWWTGTTYSYVNANSDLKLNITRNTDGSFHFESDTYSVGLNNDVIAFGNYHYATESLEFDTYEGGYVATDTFEHWVMDDYDQASTMHKGDTYVRSYPIAVDMNYDTNVCTIKNFANQGYLVDNYGKISHLTGTINPATKTVTFKETTGYPQQWLYSEGYGYTLYSLNYTLHTWAEGTSGSKITGPVTAGATATYDDGEGVHHNDAEHAWVTNGGSRRTFEGFSLTFKDPLLFFMNDAGPKSPSGRYEDKFGEGFDGWAFGYHILRASAVYKNMSIGRDVTLDVDLNLNHYGVNDEQVYVNATLREYANYDYVDNYEIYMVPGKFKSISDAGFAHHLDNGHENAFCISDHLTGMVIPAAAREAASEVTRPEGGVGEHTFNLMVPVKKLLGSSDPNKGYTFFIKANYKKDEATGEPMLAPTFHSMVYLDNTTTGIADAGVDTPAALIHVSDGVINIDGTEQEAAVYATSGALIYRGFDRAIPVAPGIYIVRVGATATKTIVR